jgi:hypothetical protein
MQDEEKRTAAKQDGYLDKATLAAKLGITPRTVESWMKKGFLPFIKVGSGKRATVLYSWEVITAALAAKFGRNGAQCE